MSNSTHKLKYTGNELDKQLEKIDNLETKVANLEPSDVGLDKVDNTTDMAKPLSTKQQEYVDEQVNKLQTSIDSIRGKNYVEKTSTSGVHIGRDIKGDCKGIQAWVLEYSDYQGQLGRCHILQVDPAYEERFGEYGTPVLLITNDGHYYEGIANGVEPPSGFISVAFGGISLPIAEAITDENACTLVHLEQPDIGTIPVSLSTFTSGYRTMAVQENAVAFGEETKAIGKNSLAAGEGTHTSVKNGAVFGKYNEKDSDRIFQIGNGTSNKDRKDAFYVDKDGSAYDGNGKLVSETDIEKLKYYGATDIEITPESDFDVDGDVIIDYYGTAETVVIPYKVNGKLITDIDSYVFFNRSSLTNITIPNSVTHIGDYAFNTCENLTSITIPNSITSIGIFMFENCSSLTNITIPDSVTHIGESAFDGCNNLANINIPNSVTIIGNSAFCRCSSLTNINIPNGVTSIGKDVFRYCHSLANVTIGNGVTSIGDYAFCACENLTSIIIPNSVTSIGNSAFYGCENLTSITIGNGVTSIDSTVFGLIPENAVFYVEQGSYAETYCKENDKNYKYTNIKKDYYATNDNAVTKSSEVEDIKVTIGRENDSAAIKFDGVEKGVHRAQFALEALRDADGKEISITYFKRAHYPYGLISEWEQGKEYSNMDIVWYKSSNLTVSYYRLTRQDNTDWNTSPGNNSAWVEEPPVGLSDKAENDSDGNKISTTYVKKHDDSIDLDVKVGMNGSFTQIFVDGIAYQYNSAYYATTAGQDTRHRNIIDTYAEKTQSDTSVDTNVILILSMYDNYIVTYSNEATSITFELTGSFSPTYNCQINFTSGETPTEIAYTSTGIINWVGTDCKLQDGKSIFTPSANTRYNIVIYFDGNTFVGCVNGFTPATINNDGTEVN